MKTLATVLSVAGSDPSGGAGIQSDIKTIEACGLFGTSVITSLTIQNSEGVRARHDVDPQIVGEQLEALLQDTHPAALKTGMLGNEAIVETVARLIKRYRAKPLVVDPIIRSSSGRTLLSAKGVEVLKTRLLPLAAIVTPNLKEAEILAGFRIRKPADRLKAAKVILKTGVKSVLITGGHSRGAAEDFFYDGKNSHVFSSPRLAQNNLHGTGCVLSAALASHLAWGDSLEEAVSGAKELVTDAIALGVKTGKGSGNTNPLGGFHQDAERWLHLERLRFCLDYMKEQEWGDLVPEVQSNIGFGLEGARAFEDVAAIPGRIIRDGGRMATLHDPRFGASQHVAKIVLTAMHFDPEKRAVMNIKFQKTILDACRRLKMSIGSFDRSKEPKTVKQKEGSSLEWGTAKAIEDCGYVPEIIYDLGGQGKEEMIRVIAEDPEHLVGMVQAIHGAVHKQLAKGERETWRKR